MACGNSPPATPIRRAATRLAPLAAAGALLTAAVTGCGGGVAEGKAAGVRVVAAFYPLQFVAERVGGDAVTVRNLAKPGAEPHDLELNPRQMAEVADATLVVYLKGFQPQVDEAIDQVADDRAFDVTQATPLLPGPAGDEPADAAAARQLRNTTDPHLWLDPTRLATVADKLTDRLAAADTAHAADYTARADSLRTALESLDREYANGLRTCARREIVTSHSAFGYLADRYQLRQIGLTGLTPEDEPAPRHLDAVIRQARSHQATTIFFETLASDETAKTIATEVGAKTAVLDPIEGLEPGSPDDYFAVMRRNLRTLRAALGCP